MTSFAPGQTPARTRTSARSRTTSYRAGAIVGAILAVVGVPAVSLAGAAEAPTATTSATTVAAGSDATAAVDARRQFSIRPGESVSLVADTTADQAPLTFWAQGAVTECAPRLVMLVDATESRVVDVAGTEWQSTKVESALEPGSHAVQLIAIGPAAEECAVATTTDAAITIVEPKAGAEGEAVPPAEAAVGVAPVDTGAGDAGTSPSTTQTPATTTAAPKTPATTTTTAPKTPATTKTPATGTTTKTPSTTTTTKTPATTTTTKPPATRDESRQQDPDHHDEDADHNHAFHLDAFRADPHEHLVGHGQPGARHGQVAVDRRRREAAGDGVGDGQRVRRQRRTRARRRPPRPGPRPRACAR